MNNKDNAIPIVVIVGPTASGKSALALKVAQRFNGEIICADSRTIYKGMDIGTAKPTKVERRKVKHHLLDIAIPGETFSAAKFKQLANQAVGDIAAKGKLPILVGGTGLYIDSVIFDYQFGNPSQPALRSGLEKLSVPELQDICRQKNINLPINNTNRRHLIRAIEIGGLLKQKNQLRGHTIVVGLTSDRAKLQSRIQQRIVDMLRQGVIEEAKQLAKKYTWQGEAMSANIYRFAKEYIEGSIDQEIFVQYVTGADMKLAKRQLTWFKRNPYIVWSESEGELITKIGQFVRGRG